MSVHDLNRLYNRFSETVRVNFSKPLAIDAIVLSVNKEENKFTITTSNKDRVLDCYTKQSIAELKENDKIRLKAKMETNSGGMIYLNVEYFYTVDQTMTYTEKIEIYSKLKNILLNSKNKKCQLIIQQHYQKPIPTQVYNIGLIVFPDDNVNIDNFKKMYQEKCVGELFIYHLQNGSIDQDFRSAMKYFHKYHQIDLICILSNQIPMDEILQMSSKNNVIYLLNRKKFPYIISTINNNIEMKPLSALLSNKTFGNLMDCINFIQNIQSSFSRQLSDSIESGLKRLGEILVKHKQRLLNLKLSIGELNDPRFPAKIDSSNEFERLKNLVLKRLAKDRMLLSNIKILVMKKVIEDPTVKKIYTEIIDSQNKKNNEQKKIENKTSENSLNDKLSINIQRQNGEF